MAYDAISTFSCDILTKVERIECFSDFSPKKHCLKRCQISYSRLAHKIKSVRVYIEKFKWRSETSMIYMKCTLA